MRRTAVLALRILATWAVQVAAFAIMLRILPGVAVETWNELVVSVLLIGLLNALVRPLVLRLSARLGIVPFLLVGLFLNVALVMVAAQLVGGFTIDSLWTGFLLATGLALLNVTISSILSIDDDDWFYRNVIRHLAERRVPPDEPERTGTVIVQIDGLAEPLLRRALASGRMPTLASWLHSGRHRLVGWECQIPSMTTASQAGVLHGNYDDLPAFYWYVKEERRLMASGRPSDLHGEERRLSNGRGLLAGDGMAVMALFSGDAERSMMTTTRLVDDAGNLTVNPLDFYAYALDPYNAYRGLAGMLGEALLECWQAFRQWMKNVQPRTRRVGKFVLMRGGSNVVARDATTWSVTLAMYQGRPIVFCNYLGYDEVGHYAGPETHDALGTLRGIDRQLRHLERAAQEAPRPYQFVVYSDHGQTTGHLFSRVYGKPLDALVQDLTQADSSVLLSGARDEGRGYISAFLTELVGGSGRSGRAARRVLKRQRHGGEAVDLLSHGKKRERASRAEVVVTSSGNLGHIYFAQIPQRLTLEQLITAYPGLIEALVGHDGIGFVLVLSETRGPIVFGKQGIRELEPDRLVEGADPLAQFSPNTARFLCRLARYRHSGDVIVNGTYHPVSGQVITLDELVGAHGGVGGMQTEPFLIYPTAWTAGDAEAPTIVGADQLHHFLRRHALGEEDTTPTEGAPRPEGAAPAERLTRPAHPV